MTLEVAALRIGADDDDWRALGFDVNRDGVVMLGPVRLELSHEVERGRIGSWALEGERVPEAIDGLPTEQFERTGAGSDHPNGASSIDHIVVLTPSLDRTTAAFAGIGIECRRIREAGGGVRQGFFLMADVLVEVVEAPGKREGDPARFWGVTVVVEDLDRAAELLGDRLGTVKDAVQPGRRIATVRHEASGGLPLALITPRGSTAS